MAGARRLFYGMGEYWWSETHCRSYMSLPLIGQCNEWPSALYTYLIWHALLYAVITFGSDGKCSLN